ncbi:transcriptional regulator [Saccharibacillus sp. O16]|nr:transcriptional regulator [Saccharibacillus sp. O16]
MLLLLLEEKKTTAPELARRFEVSVRTIYRDIDRLSAAGIPVYTSTGKHGGIHLMDNYVMDKSLLSEEEQNEILLGLYSVSAIPHLNGNRMLTRLTTLFDHKLDWIEFEHSPWGSVPDQEMNRFHLVKQAIFARQLLAFHYIDSNGLASEQTALPVKLIFKNHTWYFKGWRPPDLNTDQAETFDTFKIKRITHLHVVSGRDSSLSTIPPSEEDQEMVHKPPAIEVLFSSTVAYRVRDLLDPSAIREEVDGKLYVSMELVEDERLYSFLLSFGGDVSVLQPAHVRHELLRRHRRAVEHLLADDTDC